MFCCEKYKRERNTCVGMSSKCVSHECFHHLANFKSSLLQGKDWRKTVSVILFKLFFVLSSSYHISCRCGRPYRWTYAGCFLCVKSSKLRQLGVHLKASTVYFLAPSSLSCDCTPKIPPPPADPPPFTIIMQLYTPKTGWDRAPPLRMRRLDRTHFMGTLCGEGQEGQPEEEADVSSSVQFGSKTFLQVTFTPTHSDSNRLWMNFSSVKLIQFYSLQFYSILLYSIHVLVIP